MRRPRPLSLPPTLLFFLCSSSFLLHLFMFLLRLPQFQINIPSRFSPVSIPTLHTHVWSGHSSHAPFYMSLARYFCSRSYSAFPLTFSTLHSHSASACMIISDQNSQSAFPLTIPTQHSHSAFLLTFPTQYSHSAFPLCIPTSRLSTPFHAHPSVTLSLHSRSSLSRHSFLAFPVSRAHKNTLRTPPRYYYLPFPPIIPTERFQPSLLLLNSLT